MNRLFSIAAALLVIIMAVVALSLRSYLFSPLAGLEKPMLYEISQGASLSGVAYDLEAQGVLTSPAIFVAWGRFTGQAAALQTGEFELLPGSSPKEILDQFVNGRVKLYPFTILEGWTYRDLWSALAGKPFIANGFIDLSYTKQLELLSLDAGHPEGQFYPETYLVPRGTTEVEILRQANALMQAELADAWESRDVGLPLKTPYELLTLASIIERETALDSERPQVAGVFIRRLNKNMRLQTDPTVIYGLGEGYDGNITRKDLLTDTPYNTYTRGGLPPTPIGMPGRASLQAAAHPAEGDTLYFVATGESDGSHVFSRTLEEHNAAVAAYIARLRQLRKQAEEANK
ncbi:MAG: endolytic transglycosylase MltG [Gammaproteobacteria bacterium]